MPSELLRLSALEQAQRVRARQVKPVELVEASIAQVERFDGAIGAFVTRAFDAAREHAVAAEQRLMDESDDLPPFHGVPYAIKDENSTADMVTTFGTKAYADHIPATDTNSVRRIRAAGFIALGKTNNPELGSLPITESNLLGPCRTPWDLGHTSGGSSGGSAAAVAAGMVAAADAADGGGSIRMPASCCGLVGLKPTRGRISFEPYGFPLEGFGVMGCVSRTVADTAAILDVLEGYEMGDPYWAPPPTRPFLQEVGAPVEPLRVALTTTPLWPVDVDTECQQAVAAAGRLLESLGHHVVDGGPDWGDGRLNELFRNVWRTGPSLAGIDDIFLMEPHNRLFAEQARATFAPDYLAGVSELQRECRRIVQFWSDIDVVVTPTLSRPPVPLGWVFQDDDESKVFDRALEFAAFTPIANATGQPSISLPLHWTASGLPVGVQFMGPPAGEALLLRLAAQIEAAQPWRDRWPSLVAGSD